MSYRTFQDRTGERYGRLVIIGFAGSGDHSRQWKCKCDCGNEVIVSWKQLQQNHKSSCGCLREETRTTFGGLAGANKKSIGESAFNQLLYNYKKSAKKRGHKFELTRDEFKHLTSQHCYYCGQPANRPAPRAKGTNGEYLYNGLDRIDNSKGYIVGNVRSCCKQCNVAKGALTEKNFLDWIKKVSARSTRFEHGEEP